MQLRALHSWRGGGLLHRHLELYDTPLAEYAGEEYSFELYTAGGEEGSSSRHFELDNTPLAEDAIEECSTEPLCFWDKDGLDEHHDPGPTGCYPYHECKSMHGTKESCIGHLYCHYAAFDMCLLSHHDAMPFNNKYNSSNYCRFN